eukprot:gnl/Ergobibamus_cyprinoides/3575.p1 GENE.gnl/Ergobibamus_cyprinoides/3575~~gnl/Ergobibamus_cyprinoides/3575.p1  ORF type:complete len:255 (+),score=45.71 gnl/Ergobibamus_cyprinoides/3575:298-1062(+)
MVNNHNETGLYYACRNSGPGRAECVALHLPREYDVMTLGLLRGPDFSGSADEHDLLHAVLSVNVHCTTSYEKSAIVVAFVRFRRLTADEAAALSDADARVAFRIAAQCGRVGAVRALAPRCAGTLYYRGRPAITYAICEGQTAVVEALLPFEAGIVDADGYSNLQLACAVALPEIVKLLRGPVSRRRRLSRPVGRSPGRQLSRRLRQLLSRPFGLQSGARTLLLLPPLCPLLCLISSSPRYDESFTPADFAFEA